MGHRRAREFVTALKIDTRVDLIATDDIGAFARAAFENRSNSTAKTFTQRSELLAMCKVAAALSRRVCKKVVAFALSPAEAVARGLHLGVVN